MQSKQIGSVCFGRLSSQYFSCQQEKSTFLLIKFKHNFCSVSISHLHFLIRSFRLLKQFLRSPGHLFQDKKILGISNTQLNSDYFLVPVNVRVINSPMWIYFGVLVLFLTGKIMFTSLIDYFSKQQLSAFNNDCWNFHKPKQQYQLISWISQIFNMSEWYLSIDIIKWSSLSILKSWRVWKPPAIMWYRL